MSGIKKTKSSVGAAGKVYAAAIACACLFAVAVHAQHGQKSVISDVELMAGDRGLMLLINGNGPITLGEQQAGQLEKSTAKYAEVRLTVAGARVGLVASRFEPPASIPVQSITIRENRDGAELNLAMRGQINGPVQVRGSDNQIRILLARDAMPEVVWTAARGLISGSPGAQPAPVTVHADSVPTVSATAVSAAAQVAVAKPDVTIPSDAEIKAEPVDMKKMEERAVRDMQSSPDRMFPVKEAPASLLQTVRVPPPEQPLLQTVRVQSPEQPLLQAVEITPSAPVEKMPPPIELSRPEVPIAQPENVPTRIFHDSGEPAKPHQASGLVRYKVFGRDPFVPLVRDPNAVSELPRVENLRLVGVLEDARERIALLEDFTNNNRAFALRVNDPVEYGKVLRVQRNKVVFLIRDFDVSRSYTLGITRDAAAGGNARRR